MINAHSPKYNADGSIELIVKFPWIEFEVPFSASPTDSEQHGRDLFARAIAGDFGVIAPYVAPPPVVPSSVSAWQIRKALNRMGLRAAVEAAVAACGDQDTIDGWDTARDFLRNDPLVVGMGTALGKSAAEMDALFILAAGL